MKTQGQITLFIILGIVLAVGIGLVLSLKPSTDDLVRTIEVPALLEPVYTHVEDCIRDTAVPALYLMGMQGGYIYITQEYVSTYYSDVAYSYLNDRSVMPTLKDMESQLETYMEEALPACPNFNLFPDLEISTENVTAGVKITTKGVVFNIEYPIVGVKGESSNEVKDFSMNIPIRLFHIYNVLGGIVSKTLEDPDWVDMSYLSEFKDVKIEIVPYNEDTMIYSITDETIPEPYIFLSAFSFKKNTAPGINMNDTIYLEDGAPFLMEVEVTDQEGDDFTCSDDTSLFQITDNCIILFTPDIPGRYNVTIEAKDIRQNKAYKNVEFVVIG